MGDNYVDSSVTNNFREFDNIQTDHNMHAMDTSHNLQSAIQQQNGPTSINVISTNNSSSTGNAMNTLVQQTNLPKQVTQPAQRNLVHLLQPSQQPTPRVGQPQIVPAGSIPTTGNFTRVSISDSQLIHNHQLNNNGNVPNPQSTQQIMVPRSNNNSNYVTTQPVLQPTGAPRGLTQGQGNAGMVQTYSSNIRPQQGGTPIIMPQPQQSQSQMQYSSQMIAPSVGMSATSAVATDPEKRRLIQQQLMFLLHANRCQRQEQDNGTDNNCTMAHCRTMRLVLAHLANCNVGKNCPTPHCASSRQIISHWKNCSSKDCPVCEPLKQQNQRGQNRVLRIVSDTPMNGVHLRSNTIQQQPTHQLVPMAQGSVASQQSLGIDPLLSQTQIHQSGPSSGSTQWSDPQINGVSSQANGSDDTWRSAVSTNQRQHLVRRIVQTIFPAPDPSAYKDPRMKNLIEYAKKVEREMYQIANNREEYFHLLAEKCYKIHKELEEKRKNRQPSLQPQSSLPQSVSSGTGVVPVSGGSGPSAANSSSTATGMNYSPRAAINPPARLPSTVNSSINNLLNDVTESMHAPLNSGSGISVGNFPSTLNESESDSDNIKKFEHMLQNSLQATMSSIPASGDSIGHSNTSDFTPPAAEMRNSQSNPNLVQTNLKLEPKLESVKSPPSVGKPSEPSSVTSNVSEPFRGTIPKTEIKDDPTGSLFQSDGPPSSSRMSSDLVNQPDTSKWKKWTREELLRNFLSVHADVSKEKDAAPFLHPVDYKRLAIPDYPKVIRFPMDLSTIRQKLDDGKFTDPWDVVDDFWLMFNNAWLYNKKTSKVYKMCTKLAEFFEPRIDKVMQSMGFCCGREYVFQPQVLYCSSAQMCTINRDSNYYVFDNTDKVGGLICEKYYNCEKCFSEPGTDVMLCDEPNQPPVPIKKELFVRKKNNEKEKEEFVRCKECGRKWHKICACHLDEIWPSGFICNTCCKERNLRRKENKFTAKKLPRCKMSSFIEKRVNDFLKKKEPGINEVIIRVLSVTDKVVEVKPGMRSRFTEAGEMEESFPYRLKAIFAFQEIDGQEVCFFGLHVQEYGSKCPQPNTRRVYIAYLDSVFFFKPKQYRTDVYHEILVAYLHYVKLLGYTMAHIWACPPSEGDDYIFHMHPQDQKIPKPKRLQDWYHKMLEKALIERIVVDYKDILRDACENNLVSPTEIPYFEGDFWPNTLEEIFKELEEEEEKRRREKEALEKAELEDDDEIDTEPTDIDKKNAGSKKKPKKRKGKSKTSNTIGAKRKKTSNTPLDGGNELSRKVYETMEKHKEVFFVVRLHSPNMAANLPEINDPDGYIQSDLMDGRDAFLQLAREKHLEFSSLRRAKYSTLVMLYELHNEGRQSFMYNCNVCNVQIDTRWHCTECEEYDLCMRCYETQNHPHKMTKIGLGLDDENDSSDKNENNPPQSRRDSIERCIKSLVHACQCRDANCHTPTCVKMKRVLCHTRNCKKKSNGGCALCKQLIALCCYHAKFCKEPKCSVPFCQNIKYRLKQQQLQQRLQQAKMLRRRMQTMQRTHTGPVTGQTLVSAPGSDSVSQLQVTSTFQGSGGTVAVNPYSITSQGVTNPTIKPQQTNEQFYSVPQGTQPTVQTVPRSTIQVTSGGITQQLVLGANNQVPQAAVSSTVINPAAAIQNPQHMREIQEKFSTFKEVYNQMRQKYGNTTEFKQKFFEWLQENPDKKEAYRFFLQQNQNQQKLQLQQQQQQQQQQGNVTVAYHPVSSNQTPNSQLRQIMLPGGSGQPNPQAAVNAAASQQQWNQLQQQQRQSQQAQPTTHFQRANTVTIVQQQPIPQSNQQASTGAANIMTSGYSTLSQQQAVVAQQQQRNQIAARQVVAANPAAYASQNKSGSSQGVVISDSNNHLMLSQLQSPNSGQLSAATSQRPLTYTQPGSDLLSDVTGGNASTSVKADQLERFAENL